MASLDATLLSSTLPNTNDDGIVCLGSVRVSGASVGERVDALIGRLLADSTSRAGLLQRTGLTPGHARDAHRCPQIHQRMR